MKTNQIFKTLFCKKIILTILTGLCLTGCIASQNPKTPAMTAYDCVMPKTMNLAQAIDETKQALAHEECIYEFKNYFNNLLEIGGKDPSMENKEKFSNFLVWSNETGILSKIQAKEYYNQYFNIIFTCLPADYNVCSISAKKNEIIKAMEAELVQKEIGLLKICEDQKTYYSAHEQLDTMILLIEAICLACENN